MAEKKTLEELTLMDDYMFAQVMRNTKYVKPLLEYILKVRISKITLIEPQKTEKEGYDSKGVRLDLYVVDEDGVIYNVEVQTSNKKNISRRMRYYQSIVDVSILEPGRDYNALKKSFIIFICNYDPFNRSRYIYTFENTCREEPDLVFGDDTYKIVVNTKGTKGEISDELKEIILYLDSEKVTGEFSRELDEAVKAIKADEGRRLEYMMLYIRDNEMRAEGRAEGIAGAVDIMRDDGKSDQEIIEKIKNKFGLTQEQAEEYVLAPAVV